MKAKLPVGVIGLGRMGQVYARHLASRTPQARVVAVADALEERARTFADEWGIETWSTD